MESLAEGVLGGNRLALARLLTQVENDTPTGRAALNDLFPFTGHAHLIGVTGAPGTGKSSLVNQLARHFRQPQGEQAPVRVGILAVDPSSPFTGGAILGDRVRMRDLSGDPGVFIRSMASRGSLGGLASATASLVLALDAAGFETILIETVGAGQAEVDIARLAHTTLVVEAPGLGDDIQAIKAGILEIADILVINKADRPGVENTERALRGMLQLAMPGPRVFIHHGLADSSGNTRERMEPGTAEAVAGGPVWHPPVLRTVATEASGIVELAQEISRHKKYLKESGDWERRERARLQTDLQLLLQSALLNRWQARLPESKYQEVVNRLSQREMSPWQAVQLLIEGEDR